METLGKKIEIARKLQTALKLRISQRRLDLSQVAQYLQSGDTK